MKTKALLLFTILALAAFAAGCGSKGASVSDINTEPATPATSSDTSSEDSKPAKTVQPKVSGSLSSKPKISDASGDPPSKMIEKDIKVGSGKTAKSGDKVTVNYVGHNWSNNQEFDTSWGKQAFSFTLGEGQVIAGWDEGVEGMKVGGRRLLIIPPDKGYGAQGQGSIPANETLIFVVDLKKVS
jgi:FKBP-type peptidyl-prolyl cis-trans isomerase